MPNSYLITPRSQPLVGFPVSSPAAQADLRVLVSFTFRALSSILFSAKSPEPLVPFSALRNPVFRYLYGDVQTGDKPNMGE